jgi:pilus assembly protein CpaF
VSGSPPLLDRVRRRLAEDGGEATGGRVAAAVRTEAGLRGDRGLLSVLPELQRELTGVGPLEALLADDSVCDVLVNAPDEVWVDRGRGLVPAAVRFPDEESVRRLAVRLAAAAGRRLDAAAPYVDARLPGGTRFHAVLPPIAPRGTCLSLRVFRDRGFDVAELVRRGSLTPLLAALLTAVVGARLAAVVSGGTGSGKTTLLGALLGLAPPDERLLVVEDAGELRVSHPHVVRLEARPANVEGAGAVTLRDLVRQALRMRPDRLVIGEVRGAEIADLLLALNTGHEGGLTTVHANGAHEVPPRVEALGALAGLDRRAVHAQLAAALHVVVHLVRDAGGLRRVVEIAVCGSGPDGLVTVSPACRWDGPGPAADRLAALLATRGVRPPAGLVGAVG